jgi:hypothetical protein
MPKKKLDKKIIAIYSILISISLFSLYMFFTFTPNKLALYFTANPAFPHSWILTITIINYFFLGLAILISIFLIQGIIIKKNKTEILILLIVIILFLVIGEIISCGLFKLFPQKEFIRTKLFFSENPNALYEPHHYMNYALQKNYVQPISKDIHNSWGFRGKEFEIIKPDNTFRIVTLGGSTTYGQSVDFYYESYPYFLEQILNKKDNLKKINYSKIEVINAGIGGYTTWETLINFQFKVLPLNPDLIIIYHGYNDVSARLINPQEYYPDNSGYRKQWSKPPRHIIFKSKFIRLLMPISSFSTLSHYTSINGKTISGTDSEEFNPKINTKPIEAINKNKPIYFESNIKSIIGIANVNDIDVMLSTFSYYPRGDCLTSFYSKGMEEHNEVIKKLHTEYKTSYCDINEKMKNSDKYDNVFIDCIHVNEIGNKLKAKFFSDCILENDIK